MTHFKVKDLMVTIDPNDSSDYRDGNLKTDYRELQAGCMAVSKCSQTKPDCMAVSKCSQTKPDCMAVSKCSQTKPGKRHDNISAYSAHLFNLKQTIAAMQAK
jgi:hypothetical protein